MSTTRRPRSRPIRLAAVAAHPVSYQAPLYRQIEQETDIDLTVIYSSDLGVRPYRDSGFGDAEIQWGDDLLDGYHHLFLQASGRNLPAGGFLDLHDGDIGSALRRGSYDVVWVHGYSYLTMWHAMVTALRLRKPLLIREEQTMLQSRPLLKAAPRALILRSLFSRVFGLYIGANNHAFFRHYGVPEKRLFWVPYCVDNSVLQQQARELRPVQSELRQEFGITDRISPVILFVGKLIEKKQPGILLEAFRRVRRNHPCSLLVVGDGPLRQELCHRVAQNSIPDVYFAGFVSPARVGRAFAASDIFVLPSERHETWGLVTNEAMNFSLPVIVSDKVGCAPDLVTSGYNGYVFPHQSVDALTTVLSSLVTDSQLRFQFGERSRLAVGRFDYRTAREGVIEACYQAIGHDGPGQ